MLQDEVMEGKAIKKMRQLFVAKNNDYVK